MKYYKIRDQLFRKDETKGERYDEAAGGWVDVGNLLTQAEMGGDPFLDDITEDEVKKAFPAALAAGTAEAVTNAGAQGDSRFNALTVDDLSRIQGYVMAGHPVEKYIEDNKLAAGSEEARQAKAYGAVIDEAMDALEPGQTLHVPGEWT